jgi:steroid 5-alpha reductase family enzyme
MNIFSPPVEGLVAIGAVMILLWFFSVFLRNVSIIDLFWGPVIAIAGLAYWLGLDEPGMRANIVLGLAWVWALRLGIYLFSRNAGKPEDRRYVDMRRRNDPAFWLKSLYLVFALQAVLAWIVSAPLYGAMHGSSEMGLLDYLGIAIFVFGFVWETFADAQLAAFLRNRKNTDAVMDGGLWRYSRHPNYFGEFCLWWGFGLIAVSAGAAWTLIGPLVLSFFLLKVSGVAMLEKDIGGRRPAYQEYIEKTSAFLPRPPRT